MISMFGGLAAGWADLILPGTSYLERDGTFVNLEGRLQRLRRTVDAAVPRRARVDLAARRALRRRRRAVRRRASSPRSRRKVYGGLRFGEVGERAPLRGYPDAQEHVARAGPAGAASRRRSEGEIRLVAYKPLFSGAAVERVTELQFQRPQPELELSADDAGGAGSRPATSSPSGSNGSAITLPARVNRRLRTGIARVALEHADGLGGIVEVAEGRGGGERMTRALVDRAHRGDRSSSTSCSASSPT